MADHGLAAESVNRSTERLIKIEARRQVLIAAHLVDSRAEYHALHDVGRAQVPYLAGEHNVVGAVYFRPVVPRACKARKRQASFSPSKLHVEKTLGNVHGRRSVLTHRSELNKVGFRPDVADRVEQVQSRGDVVRLHEYGVMNIDHRIR